MAELASELIETFQSEVKIWQAEILGVLPITLGVKTSVSSNGYIMPHTGVGGRAISADKIHIGFQPDFAGSIQQQVENAAPVYKHESFHIAQKRNARRRAEQDTPPSAIDAAILEGGGTVFERIYGASTPPWGKYEDVDTMVRLTQEMVALPADYDVTRWMFRDLETNRLWTGYKVGTFVIDEAMRKTDVKIEELAAISPQEILDLSGII